ncbi:MaoC family dehydratase [Hyphomicrobium sp.]|uniref:MaoC family dehydratase n=1 Tax=Hyphomicrobium sp. TaxID=82 RepID=UPI003F6FB768
MNIESTCAWATTIKGKPAVGAHARRSRRTSAEDIRRFSELTGDYNPLHYDAELAETSVFGKIIVQGGVTSGLLNAIVAEDLPGPGTVFLGVNWRFLRAVGVDETITAEVKVTSVRDDKPICELETTIFDENGNACLTGSATVYVTPLQKRAVAHDAGNAVREQAK